MTQIIGISGKKQSGKDTVTNFLHGYIMMQHDVINQFFISKYGELVIDVDKKNDNGSETIEMGVLDLNQKNEAFINYASNRIWPLIKKYSFADPLKEMLHVMFDIPLDNLYGTNEQKDQKIEHLLWENLPYKTGKTGPMSSREFMQQFGTKIMRKIYKKIWLNNCFKRIDFDEPDKAVINDCRFLDEVEEIKANNGIVIRLLRDIHQEKDESETALDNYDNFDIVIDNREIGIVETNNLVLQELINRGILHSMNMSAKNVTLE